MNIGNMRFKATLLSEGFGTNLTNELGRYAAFVSSVSNKIPFIFVRFQTLFALIFIGTCKKMLYYN